jgi:hypothetical protein
MSVPDRPIIGHDRKIHKTGLGVARFPLLNVARLFQV